MKHRVGNSITVLLATFNSQGTIKQKISFYYKFFWLNKETYRETPSF